MGRTKRKRIRKRTGVSTQPLDADIMMIELKKFMANNGYKDEFNLQLRNFPETGRGVATKKVLHQHDTLIRIPYNLLVTLSTLQAINCYSLFIPSAKLTIHALLAVFLVMEKHKKGLSHWSSYINSLPITPPWLPGLLPSNYIELLPVELRLHAEKSRKLFEETWLRLRKSIRRDWTCDCCAKKADCVLNMNTFTWAYILVNTRAVYIDPAVVKKMYCDRSEDILSDEPCMALCPFLDMFNHSYEANTNAELIFYEGDLVYQLTTLTSVEKYGQVFISYGAHDNVTLLSEYGFFIPSNLFDSVGLTSDDLISVLNLKLTDYQYKFLQMHNFLDSLYISETGPSFNLKAFLFVLHHCEMRSFTATIYNESYSDDFKTKILKLSRKLLRHVLKLSVKSLDDIEKCPDKDMLVLRAFLRYRVNHIKTLCDNKQ